MSPEPRAWMLLPGLLLVADAHFGDGVGTGWRPDIFLLTLLLPVAFPLCGCTCLVSKYFPPILFFFFFFLNQGTLFIF